MKNKTLMTDFYELTMGQTYFLSGKHKEKVYFDIFFRKNPLNSGYTMNGGLDEIIDYIRNFHFEKEEIDYLRGLGKFTDKFLDYLENLTFEGNVYAIPDGTPIFPKEPVITVEADALAAQLLETAILANFNFASLITTAAKRITKAAGDVDVMEFGARRAHGQDAAVEASKYGYIGGCVGTSNTLTCMKYGIPELGTTAHAQVVFEDEEYEAMLAYAKANPNNCLFLVDTYNTLERGIPNAIRVANEYLTPNGYAFKGIRIDSGDLLDLTKKARKMLDDAGYSEAKICVSNGLDEYMIKELLENGAPIDSIGAGDNIVTPQAKNGGVARVGGVYKLVAKEVDGKIMPRIKISDDKAKMTLPGFKKTYRLYDKENGKAIGDVIALNEEQLMNNNYTLYNPVTKEKITVDDYEVRELQVPLFKNGELVYQNPTATEKREYCEEQYQTLPENVTRIDNPEQYPVMLTDNLQELLDQLIEEYTEENLEEKTFQKVKK